MPVTFTVTRRTSYGDHPAYDPAADPCCTPTGRTEHTWVGKEDPEADADGYAEVMTYRRVIYTGAVLETREYNGHDDSDFYALVWDEAAQKVERVDYATTRFHCTGSASEDATPEVRAKAAEWCRRLWVVQATAESARDARVPLTGRRVRVVGGRKHKGKEGTVFFREERRSFHGTWSYGFRIGVRPSDEKEGKFWKDAFFLDEKHVEVIDPEQYEVSADALQEQSLRVTEAHAALLLNPRHIPTIL